MTTMPWPKWREPRTVTTTNGIPSSPLSMRAIGSKPSRQTRWKTMAPAVVMVAEVVVAIMVAAVAEAAGASPAAVKVAADGPANALMKELIGRMTAKAVMAAMERMHATNGMGYIGVCHIS